VRRETHQTNRRAGYSAISNEEQDQTHFDKNLGVGGIKGFCELVAMTLAKV